jgi:hypothetical protein
MIKGRSQMGYNIIVRNDSGDIVLGYIEGDVETVMHAAEDCADSILGSALVTNQDDLLMYRYQVFDVYEDHTSLIC